MALEKTLEVLENREKEILLALGKNDGSTVEDVAKLTNAKADSVRHDVARLTELRLVDLKMEPLHIIKLTSDGKDAAKKGLIEQIFINQINKGLIKTLDRKDVIAFGQAKRKG